MCQTDWTALVDQTGPVLAEIHLVEIQLPFHGLLAQALLKQVHLLGTWTFAAAAVAVVEV